MDANSVRRRPNDRKQSINLNRFYRSDANSWRPILACKERSDAQLSCLCRYPHIIRGQYTTRYTTTKRLRICNIIFERFFLIMKKYFFVSVNDKNKRQIFVLRMWPHFLRFLFEILDSCMKTKTLPQHCYRFFIFFSFGKTIFT